MFIHTVNQSFYFREDEVNNKLEGIAALNGKKNVAWIRSDLSTKESNWLSRLIWSVVAKHFSGMRERYYNVDLEKSRILLEKIGENIDTENTAMVDLFNKAVSSFNEIAPKHTANSVENPIKKLGIKTKEELEPVNSTILQLPDELLREIFDRIPFEGKYMKNPIIRTFFKTAACVSKKWAELTTRARISFLNERPGVLLSHMKINAKGLVNKYGKEVKSLNFKDSGMNFGPSEYMEKLFNGCPELNNLYIDSKPYTGSIINDLTFKVIAEKLPKLQTLRCFVKSGEVTDKALGYLKSLSSLRVLELKAYNAERLEITNNGINHLQDLEQLEKLKIKDRSNGNKLINGEGLAELKSLKRFRTLVWRSFNVNDEDLKQIGALKNLKTLELETSMISIEGLKHIANLGNLEKLRFKYVPNKILEKPVLLPLVEKLHTLILGKPSSKGEYTDLTKIQYLKNLKKIEFSCCDFTDQDFNNLSDFENLEELVLRNFWLNPKNRDSNYTIGALVKILTKLKNFRTLKIMESFGYEKLMFSKEILVELIKSEHTEEEAAEYFRKNAIVIYC